MRHILLLALLAGCNGVSTNPVANDLSSTVSGDLHVLVDMHRLSPIAGGCSSTSNCMAGLVCVPSTGGQCVSQAACVAPDLGTLPSTHNPDFGLCNYQGGTSNPPISFTQGFSGNSCFLSGGCDEHNYLLSCDGTTCTCYVQGCASRTFQQPAGFCDQPSDDVKWQNQVVSSCGFP